MQEKELDRLKKIEARKVLKDQKELEALTFSPLINEKKSRGRRTLEEIISDLYTKPMQ